MEDILDSIGEFQVSSERGGTATILKIYVENFMCHSRLEIEFCEWVNFITDQNGSKCQQTIILYLVPVDLLFFSWNG